MRERLGESRKRLAKLKSSSKKLEKELQNFRKRTRESGKGQEKLKPGSKPLERN